MTRAGYGRTMFPMPRLLLTAFEPFGGLEVNPSWEAIRPLDGEVWGRTIVRAVRLPVSWTRGPAALLDAIETFRPDAVVMFGVATERRAISLERFAANRCATKRADNDGATREGPIEPGPERRESTLPLEGIRAALDGFPVELSDDAGGYLCNRVFWEARARFAGPAGFVHVPPLEVLPLERVRAAARAVADAVAFEPVALAAVTTAPVYGDVARNVAEIERLARRAREAGARLALFPELATTGIAIPSHAAAARLAEPAEGPTGARLAALARETGVWIGYGFAESRGRALFNSAALLGPTGERFLYRKRRLYGHDFNWAAEGDGGGPFDTALGRVQVVICHDCVYSDIAAESEGCDLVLMPTNWIGEEGPERHLAGFRAPVLAADRSGEEDGIGFGGRSGLYEAGERRGAGGIAIWKRPAVGST